MSGALWQVWAGRSATVQALTKARWYWAFNKWKPLMRIYWVDRCVAAVTALLTLLVITQFVVRPVAINSEINTSVMGHGAQFEKQTLW